MIENGATTPEQQDDDQHDDDQHDDTQGHRPALDEGDDTQGHLMIRTDDTITLGKKVHGAPRRS